MPQKLGDPTQLSLCHWKKTTFLAHTFRRDIWQSGESISEKLFKMLCIIWKVITCHIHEKNWNRHSHCNICNANLLYINSVVSIKIYVCIWTACMVGCRIRIQQMSARFCRSQLNNASHSTN